MFTGQSVPAVHNNLVDLTDLWFRGFRNAYDSLFGNVKSAPLEVRNERLVIEILWATIFWLLTFATILALRGTFFPAMAHYATDIGGFIANLLTALASIGWGWGTLILLVSTLFAFVAGTMVAFSAADERRRREAARDSPSTAHQGAKPGETKR